MTEATDVTDGADVALVGAESVFGYLERTAEWVPDGVRWRTLSYRNEPQYDSSLFNGVAGIVLFLADYAAVTGSGAALRLAAGGARWCSAPERPPSLAPLGVGSADPHSLYAGAAGRGLAWLRVAAALGQAGHTEEAATRSHARPRPAEPA